MTRAERGSTSVAMLAVLVLGMVCAIGAAHLGAGLVARARAQTAADAAALAAAGALALGAPPDAARSVAADTAAANGARLLACACGVPRVTVTVAVDALPLGRAARVRASAEVRDTVLPPP